jgi:nicotinic acid mononucleotide adenylyltransferase
VRLRNSCRYSRNSRLRLFTNYFRFSKVRDIINAIDDQLRTDFPFRQFKIIEICGSDHALKFSLWNSPSDIICVGRKGSTENLKEVTVPELIPLLIPPEHTHENLLQPCKFHIVDDELENVSSSKIRDLLREGKIKELEDLEWLHQDVLHYINKNDPRIYH